MSYSLFDHPSFRTLLTDTDTDALFSPRAELRAMMLFEGAVAEAQAVAGIIPAESAEAIFRAAHDIQIDPSELASGTAKDGLHAPKFVQLFREKMGAPEHAQYVHWGVTSQDVIDSGLILRLKRFLELIDARLSALIETLEDAAQTHRNLPIAARTRGQIATPTTFGAKIAVWCAPFRRHKERLAQLQPRLLRISLAGASGTSAVMGDKAHGVMEDVAKRLGLFPADTPWHAARDCIWELASLLGGVSGSFGKIGRDLVLLSQSEIREVLSGDGGTSSTMPHKANPVGAEVLVALSRFAGAQTGAMHPAMLHEQDRDGVAWMLEWLTLPQLCAATAAGLRIAHVQANTLRPDGKRMLKTIEATAGFMFAEACVFELAKQMPRPEAQAMIKEICAKTLTKGSDLRSTLEAEGDLGIDWDLVFSIENAIGDAANIPLRGRSS